MINRNGGTYVTNICMCIVLRPWFSNRWNDTLTLEPGFLQRKLELTI